jgi:hypothetical protein
VLGAQHLIKCPNERPPVLPIPVDSLEAERLAIKLPDESDFKHIGLIVNPNELLSIQAVLDRMAQAFEEF